MSPPRVGTFAVAALALATLLPTLATRMEAPANWGAHALTSGFGRGRLDLQGIVSEGSGSILLPPEAVTLTVRVSGAGPIQMGGEGVSRTIIATEAPTSVRFDLPQGGSVGIESPARLRLHGLALERADRSAVEMGVMAFLGLIAVFVATRGTGPAVASAVVLITAFGAMTSGSLSFTFARIGLVQLLPALFALAMVVPLILALRAARFLTRRDFSPLSLLAFFLSLALTAAQLIWFEKPLPMGDPAAYLEMGGKFADAFSRLGSPLALGPILSDLQPYLALPATGILYGLLSLIGGVGLIYAVQAIAMACSVAALVSICETEMGTRAARIALGLALLHPSFAVLPGIVQPEPFILAAWTGAALVALRSVRDGSAPRGLLGAGILMGTGLTLHPQGLSYLLLAMVLCLLPWALSFVRRPMLALAPALGVAVMLLPVAAAEHFSKPLAHVLDRQYGFFAYTSPHPLGFWLYTDSHGFQGPLRIEDTTYQKELFELKGEGEAAVSSTFADVAAFVARHPGRSAETVLTNLHRLWHQPDNPFAVPFVLPHDLQVPLHRALVVLFVLGLPALLGTRLALVALPFVILSMTYPAYHIFNKYATPALPFTIIGAVFALDKILRAAPGRRALVSGLAIAGLGALLPATAFARVGVPGGFFVPLVWALLWLGLILAVATAARIWGMDVRSRVLGGAVGFIVLIVSSWAASRNDTTRSAWSAPLETAFEVSCRTPAAQGDESGAAHPAWLLVDVQSEDGTPPTIEVNGLALETARPSMPTYGLATIRGHRDPPTFRQIWRTRLPDQLLTSGELKIRVSGGPGARIFGDIRAGDAGPRLSLGNWPHLSVYRLMHEGQYRLPTKGVAPAQACLSDRYSGRPGVALVRIPEGEETQQALKSARPLAWIF